MTREWAKGDIEDPDQTPVEMPAGFGEPETLEEIMGRMMSRQLADAAMDQGFDQFEDEDFEDEDPNLLNFTSYELQDLAGEVITDPEAPVAPVSQEGEGDALPEDQSAAGAAEEAVGEAD